MSKVSKLKKSRDNWKEKAVQRAADNRSLNREKNRLARFNVIIFRVNEKKCAPKGLRILAQGCGERRYPGWDASNKSINPNGVASL